MSSNPKEVLTEVTCFTHYEIIKINCIWVIRHILSCSELIDEWKSPVFSSSEYQDYKFSLYIKRPRSEKIDIYLLYSDPTEILESKIKYKCSILDANETETQVVESTIKVDSNNNTMRFLHRNEIPNDLLCGDKLTIYFQLSIPKMTNISRLSNPQSKSELYTDFGKLFQNGQFTDFILVANGREFHVHKAILAARSKVFAAMFEHKMQENKLNHVEISDVDPEVLQEMLQFIYTGDVIKLHKLAKFLLVVADKYDLESLKEICEKKLCEEMSVKTAVELLILADYHRAFELKEKTIKFINDNSAEVVKTKGWKSLLKTHAYLVVEAYQAMANELPK